MEDIGLDVKRLVVEDTQSCLPLWVEVVDLWETFAVRACRKEEDIPEEEDTESELNLWSPPFLSDLVVAGSVGYLFLVEYGYTRLKSNRD